MSAPVAAALAGALIGLCGTLIALDVRIALASIAGLAAVLIGGVDLGLRRIPLVERNCETPRHWLQRGALTWAWLTWAWRNGTALGIGATSRIGFWLWYLIPVSALLIAKPEIGALIYGTYGLFRGMAVWPVLLASILRRERMAADNWTWLMERLPAARRITSAQLILVGLLTVIVVGF